MYKNINLKVLAIFILCSPVKGGVTPEQVLGEYWNDPLFGEASSDKSVIVEILNDMVWPHTISGSSNQVLRILFINKSDQMHLFAISKDIQALRQNVEFKAFVKDEIYHSQLNPISNGQHTHASTELDTAKSIVIPVSKNPTILIPARDKKEILVKLDLASVINFQCVLDGHDEQEKGVLIVE